MIAGEPIQIFRLSRQLPTSIQTYSNANTGHPSYSATSQNAPAITYKIRACHQDPMTKQHFILWGDVRTVIKDADYAMDAEDGTLVPFMVNEAYEELEPRRILCHPGKILDVVTSTALTLDRPHLSTRIMDWFQSNIYPFLVFPFAYLMISVSVGAALLVMKIAELIFGSV